MIDEQINWLFHENITFGNIFVESESLNIFTIVICMPARWEVSNNSVSMSSFSDAVNINKYSDLHFSYIFYRTKVRSLHCQYHSLTYMRDEAVYSVLLVDLSKGTCQKRFSGIRPLRGGGYPTFPLRVFGQVDFPFSQKC